MIKVADITEQLLRNDEIAVEAMRLGWLNFSAYAEKILPQVEAKTFKPVKKTTVVTALARLAPIVVAEPALIQPVRLDDIVIKAPLCDVTYEKNDFTLKKAQELRDRFLGNQDFVTMTQGTSEITLIIPQKLKNECLAHFQTPPKAILENLVCVGARFSPSYISVPNIIYTLIRSLAVKNINLLEIVSTYTEISMVVSPDQMHETVGALEQFIS